MTDAGQSITKTPAVNIDSAIGRSSYQLPVFVALSVEGGEAQVAKTFASARDAFDRVFSVMLDRLRQRRAVDKVERLVPASAHLKDSVSTEYVLFVRGKAIFWFSSGAAKRAAGRKLLLEHARNLADAAQTPFYVLNTRSRKLRLAGIVFGLIILTALVDLAWHLPIHRILSLTRRDTTHAASASNDSDTMSEGRFASGARPGAQPRISHDPFANFDVLIDATPADEPFPNPVSEPAFMVHRRPSTSAWQSRAIRAPEVAHARSASTPDEPLSATVPEIRRVLAKALERRVVRETDPVPQINETSGQAANSVDTKAHNAVKPPMLSTPAPASRPQQTVGKVR